MISKIRTHNELERSFHLQLDKDKHVIISAYSVQVSDDGSIDFYHRSPTGLSFDHVGRFPKFEYFHLITPEPIFFMDDEIVEDVT